jgi:uncharacterized membrane protein YeaQ/YmgE (transglycosylase-associated protein family)
VVAAPANLAFFKQRTASECDCDLVLAGAVVMNDSLIVILLVGFVAGLLASVFVRGGGLGLLGDIALGIVGAFVGTWMFHELHWHAPFAGLAGVIAIAAIGAVLVLVVLRAIRRGTRRR